MKRQILESTSLKPGIYFSTKASVSCGRPRESKCGQFQPMRPSAFAFKKPFQGRMLNGKKIIKHFCKNVKHDILKRLYRIDREGAVNELTKIMGIS